jgi:ribosomal protein L37AE/L43A
VAMSPVRCPSCGAKLANSLIGVAEFTCRRCKSDSRLTGTGAGKFPGTGVTVYVAADVRETPGTSVNGKRPPMVAADPAEVLPTF